MSGKKANLVEDGWSNIHNESVIASCLQVRNSVYFLDSHDTGSMTAISISSHTWWQGAAVCRGDPPFADLAQIVRCSALLQHTSKTVYSSPTRHCCRIIGPSSLVNGAELSHDKGVELSKTKYFSGMNPFLQ